MPRQLRVDNGTPWGSRGDLPTDLELWLAGLGVEVRANPPRRPQDNGVVERSQGTGKRWAEPHRAASSEELQESIDAMDQIQRERYPYKGSESRLAAHAGLQHSDRSYDEAQEETFWSIDRVHDLLVRFAVPRQVDRSGTVSVYNRNYYVFKQHENHVIFVRFDPQQQRWLFHDANNHLLNHREACEIDSERIKNLTVTNRRDRDVGQSEGKTRCRDFPGTT
jgi:transposase InsO family protein